MSEKLQAIRIDLTKSNQAEAKKSLESQKQLFISSEMLQTELQKVKRDVGKQVKTGLEEAKFDTIQMI